MDGHYVKRIGSAVYQLCVWNPAEARKQIQKKKNLK
jgi:hypothetical protein